VIVLNHGKLVTQGLLESLLSGGATRVVAADVTAAQTALTEAGIEARQDGAALIVDEEDGSRVIRVLADVGIYPSQVGPARSTLESVFLGMTGESQQ
jgi:hypothetical protein